MLPGWKKRSAWEPQGLLAPDILITKVEARSQDSQTLPDAVLRFCRWCTGEAGLVREEVQPDAWRIYHSGFYIGDVSNGGHGQFAANSAMAPELLDDVEAGLNKLGLAELLAIFRRFRGLLDSDAGLKRVVMEGGGFGDIPTAIGAIDEAFFRSPERKLYAERATRWLKGAPTVAILTPREMRARQEAIVASNRQLARRRALGARRPLRARLADAALGLWDKTGFGRAGETGLDQSRRRLAGAYDWAKEVVEAQGELVEQFYPALIDGDEQWIDDILAAYRDLHARYRLETTVRWPEDSRTYAYRLQTAGAWLGRIDLLEQAADAWGRALAAGPPKYSLDPGFAWRCLGQTLVELARLDKRHKAGLAEAVQAFEQALALDSTKRDVMGNRVTDLLGRAEAHLLLAAGHRDGGHLQAARDALAEAEVVLRPDDRVRWRVVSAELLTLLTPADVRAQERARARKSLDFAIARHLEEEGSPRASPTRLKRLRELRSALGDA
ncbi:MAG: hypothetical protein QOE79_1732 [Sphingomonadales bacterium]|nr:hypothetical protein [Sphingomonadales bacterium]MEA3049648.1 hypothetical protein [Sphingomonadales bacterium]